MRSISKYSLALVAVLAVPTAALAQSRPGALPELGQQPVTKLPEELEGAEVNERLETRVPGDLQFRDENGDPIRLGDLLGDGLPVILTFNYSNCPMLCSVQLGGLVDVMTKMEWRAGQHFRVITVGLDPKEPLARVKRTKKQYLERYAQPSAEEGWRFLTGEEAAVRALAEAVGYGYRYHADKNQYAHPAVLIFLSPSGVVTRYVYGVKYKPDVMADAVASAVLGRAEESTERFILACFHYVRRDGAPGVAREIMRYGGVLFLLGMLGVAANIWRRRRSKEDVREPNL